MIAERDTPDWARDGAGWPYAEASRFPVAGGLRWHVQIAGPEDAPVCLMLHGLGAAGHSFRGLFGPLSRRFRVVVPDLPGHGFTGRPAMSGLSLPGQSRLLGALLEALETRPALAIGHSAGAAILCRMALDGRVAPRLIVGINAALKPFPGLAGQVFPSLARLLALNPAVPRFFSLGAVMDPASIERLITGTGSRIPPEGLALYRRLLRRPGHVTSALRMMALWDLAPLVADLPGLAPRLLLASGTEDRAVRPGEARAMAALVPDGEAIALPGLGHLAHEEAPERITALALDAARGAGLLPANIHALAER
ncbi:MAG: alpha/beta fold hydrolase BchO [Pseudomonadota bacterium]